VFPDREECAKQVNLGLCHDQTSLSELKNRELLLARNAGYHRKKSSTVAPSSPAGAQKQKTGSTVASPGANGKPLLDVTALASKMPRNATILYANPPPRSEADWPHFRGLMRLLHDGKMFWVGLWPRTVKGKLVYEIRLTPKDDGGAK
jgi:hypothetical protein